MSEQLFPGFRKLRLDVGDGIDINVVTGGEGPPLLLLHGHPQTHAIWHRVAPQLARHFTLRSARLWRFFKALWR
jgi:haloacetate dehalogenase